MLGTRLPATGASGGDCARNAVTRMLAIQTPIDRAENGFGEYILTSDTLCFIRIGAKQSWAALEAHAARSASGYSCCGFGEAGAAERWGGKLQAERGTRAGRSADTRMSTVPKRYNLGCGGGRSAQFLPGFSCVTKSLGSYVLILNRGRWRDVRFKFL